MKNIILILKFDMFQYYFNESVNEKEKFGRVGNTVLVSD